MQCHCTEIAQGIFKCHDVQYMRLTVHKKTEQCGIQYALLCQQLRELQTFKNSAVFIGPLCSFMHFVFFHNVSCLCEEEAVHR